MPTLDVFHAGQELLVIVTGVADVPTIRDEDSGASVILQPAILSGDIASTFIYAAGGAATPGCWMGELPHNGDGEARLLLEVDGLERRATVKWS